MNQNHKLSPREQLKPGSLSLATKIGDIALWPFMWAACGFRATGFRTGDIQNSHPWHCQRVGEEALRTLDRDLMLRIDAPKEKAMRRIPPFFHLPALGGWRDYVVIEAGAPEFFIGWAIPEATNDTDNPIYKIAQLNKLPLMTPVKMLRSGDAPWVDMFAVNSDGDQLELSIVDEGKLGDNKHPNYPLL